MITPQPSAARRARSRRVTVAGLLSLLLVLWTARPLWGQSVAEVQVTPETMTLAVGQRQAMFAAAYDRQGNLMASARFTFWSSDTMIARVLGDGTVMGVAPGLAKVEARVQGRRASMAVLITGGPDPAQDGPPAGSVLTLEPASAGLLPGESVPITALARLEDGTPVPTGRLTWRSLAPDVAAVDSAGTVIGVAPGRTIVQAGTRSGLTAALPVEVQAAEFALAPERVVLGPEETDTLAAVVPAQGARMLRAGLHWESGDTAVARVGPTGILTALAPGRTEIVARGYGQERRASLLVHRVPESVVVSPPTAAPVLLPLRATQQLVATAEAADSTPIPEARFTWTVSDTTAVGFDPATTTMVGRALGRATVTARLRGFDDVVWTVEVIPGLVAFEHATVGLAVGERRTVAARLVGDSGRVRGPASGLTWAVDRADVVQVSGEGTLDGLRPGRAIVKAAAPWGPSDSLEVIVTADLLVSSNRSGTFGLYQLRSSGVDTLRPILVDNATNVQAVLSPDRTRIAFSSNRAGSYDLMVMDAAGRNPRRITTESGSEDEPVWTPDGTRLVYTSNQPGAGSQLRSIAPDGGDPRLLTNTPGGNHSPDVSPDGRTIAFVSAREGNQEIYLMDLAGGEARRITRTGSRESSPHFLPSGELVYVAERGKGSRVFRLAPGGGEPVLLFETSQPIASFDLSRDGTRAVYVTGRLTDAAKGKAQFSLFLHPLAAGAPTQVPLRPGEQVVSPSF